MIAPPLFATAALAKLASKTSTLLGRGDGSALPGLIAETLDPHVARRLGSSFAQGTILVTGTNGKTTTTKMLAQILTDAGYDVVTNRAGSNLYRGVVSEMLRRADAFGRVQGDIGLFEVDEASLPRLARDLQPRVIAVLNLFRDQLDRYGELDTTARLIGGGIAATTADVVLYADDPLVASLGSYIETERGQEARYVGLDDVPLPALKHDVTADSLHAPNGSPLIYSRRFFGHVGHYTAQDGSFARPHPAITASKLKLGDTQSEAVITSDGHTGKLSIKLPGVYNLTNALMATGVAQQLGINIKQAVASLAKVEAPFGRVEQVEIDGKTIFLLLVKNPTGFNQVLQTFLMEQKGQYVLFAINDNFADGRDVSWLWDTALEDIAQHGHRILCGGIRASDMALRCKYAGIQSEYRDGVADSFADFVASVPQGGTGYVVPTYTAMLELRRIIGGGTALKGVRE